MLYLPPRCCPPVFFLALLLLCGMPVSVAQAPLAARADSLLRAATPRPFHGVAVVGQAGKITFSAPIGLADRKSGRPIKLRDQFAAGSISKQITAVLALREVEKENLDLHTPIRAYLPGYAASWADSVHIHHLLSHTSGASGGGSPLAFAPGSRFAYSNFGYELLGQILEHISGKSYVSLANQLFRECDMRHTFAPEGRRIRGWVPGYSETESGAFVEEKNLGQRLKMPSGGIVSCAADLIRWNEYLHGGRLLDDSSYQQMTRPHASRAHRWGTLGYGYGVQVSDAGSMEISHSGYVPGFITTLIYYPATKTSVLLWENVAWDAADMGRVFFFHDALRNLVRESW